MPDLESVLKDHGLRKTAFRKELLSMFYEARSSLTLEDIKCNIKSTKDRVTIYRALDAFEKRGLIHRVPNRRNLTRYALYHTKPGTRKSPHNHVHFICNVCNETYCMNEVKVPKIKDMKGFDIKTQNLTFTGNCPDCIEASN